MYTNISISYYFQDDKRAHHNALERKRRDHIKDSFHSLRDCVPQDDQLKVIITLNPCTWNGDCSYCNVLGGL